MLLNLLEDAITLALFLALAPAIAAVWAAQRGWEGVAWLRQTAS
jgi:hypothetical protein